MPRKAGDSHRPWRVGGASLGYIRSGIYWIDRTIHGRRFRLSTGCRTPEKALDEYRRFEKDPGHFVSLRSPGAPWDDAVREYLDYSRKVKLNSERHVYYQTSGLATLGAFTRSGSRVFLSLDAFAARDVRDYIAARSSGELGRAVGAPSINRELAYLKGLMTWARENGVTANTADTEVPLLREERGINLPVPVPQAHWMRVLRKLLPRWRIAAEIILGSGLRYSELARMARADILPAAIHVPRTKSRKARTVPVSARTAAAARHLVERESPLPHDQAGQFDRRLAAACRAAGVSRFSAHELRHTYATVCLRNGVDVRELQERLGHASIVTTQRYLHVLRATGRPRKGVGAPL